MIEWPLKGPVRPNEIKHDRGKPSLVRWITGEPRLKNVRVHGYYDYDTREIIASESDALPEQADTLAHEWGHALFPSASEAQVHRAVRRILRAARLNPIAALWIIWAAIHPKER